MIYPIVIYGSDVLRKPCDRITPDYPEVKKLVEDMFLTLGEAEGVGLAAPQIGKNIRLFIVDCTPWGEDDPECADYKRAFINPEIYALSEEKKTYNEGCLSFPGIHADVPRSLAIRMRYMDEDFVEHDEGVPRAEGLGHPARIRPHRGHRLHRPDFAPAPQPAERKADEPGKGQIPLRV